MFFYWQKNQNVRQDNLVKWLAEKFKKPINQSTLSRWIKQWKRAYSQTTYVSNFKRDHISAFEEMDKALFDWFLRCKD